MILTRRRKLKREEGIRTVDPSDTVSRFAPLLETAGMEPLEDITDMDGVGIPVYSVYREKTAKGSFGNYNGKGRTPEQAMASAVMEAMERYSAEVRDCDELVYGTVSDAEENGPTIRPESLILPQASQSLCQFSQIAWTTGYDLIQGEEVWVPACAAFYPYYPDGDFQLFRFHTNGLASGNDIEEAILHALLEVVERDAWSIAEYRDVPADDVTVEKDSVPGKLIEKFAERGIRIHLKNLTSDIGITTIGAAADDVRTKDPEMLTIGVGTHLDPNIAAVRALTEVAQSRSSHKHGVKVNAELRKATREMGYEKIKAINRMWYADGRKSVPLSSFEDRSTDYVLDDLEVVLGGLVSVGIDRAVIVDLTRDDVGVPTVRAIVPGLEIYTIDSERVGNRLVNNPDSDTPY